MNTAINQNNGLGNGIAFLFGAAFNLLANVNLLFLLDYALQAIVGGIICLAFKIIADVFSPLWLKHKEKVKDFTKLKKAKGHRLRSPTSRMLAGLRKMKRRKRNDQE
jgi:hypothetical protein